MSHARVVRGCSGRDDLSHCSLSSGTSSKVIIQILLRALSVEKDNKRDFLRSLGRDTNGISLVFMHHRDALKSGSSYQNSARITVEDCFDVSHPCLDLSTSPSLSYLFARC